MLSHILAPMIEVFRFSRSPHIVSNWPKFPFSLYSMHRSMSLVLVTGKKGHTAVDLLLVSVILVHSSVSTAITSPAITSILLVLLILIVYVLVFPQSPFSGMICNCVNTSVSFLLMICSIIRNETVVPVATASSTTQNPFASTVDNVPEQPITSAKSPVRSEGRIQSSFLVCGLISSSLQVDYVHKKQGICIDLLNK